MITNVKDLSSPNRLGNYYMEQEADKSGLFNVYNPSQDFNNFKLDNSQEPPQGYFKKNTTLDSSITDLGNMFYGQYRTNKSRFDDDIEGLNRLEEGWSINNLRAEQQSGFNKVMSGIVKGGVLAGTTFLEGTIGLPISIAYGLIGSAEGENPLEGFIDNPFTNAMKYINDKSEEKLPNYYTKEEEEKPWWENIFTANFLGDKVFKVAGFTIGAALSGKQWASGAARMMGLNKARSAFEGLAVYGSDGKKLEKLSEKLAAYVDNPELYAGVFTDELAAAAEQLKTAQPILKWTGAFTGATGEAKIEALNNSKDWAEKELNNIRESIPQINQQIMMDLAKKYPDHFKMVQTDYNSYEWQPVTEEGYNLLREESDKVYNGALEKLTQDRINYANFDFVTNFALLLLTDAFTFGKVYQGGYNTGSLSGKKLVNIDPNTGKLVRNIPSKGKKALMIAQTPLREGPIEEMSQSMFSEIAAQKYGSEINDYFKTQIDADASESTIDFIDAIGKGFSNTYLNGQAWEEGAIGALMGLMGVPAIRKSERSLGRMPFQGGIWEQIANIKDYNRIVNEIDVDEMNKYLEDVGSLDKKKDRLNTVVSLQALENGKNAAIDNKDPKAYKDQENMQLIKLMQHFKAAGQLDLFFDKLDSMGDINKDNVEDYRAMLASTDNFYATAPQDKIIETIKKNVEDTKSKLKEYLKIADDLQIQVGDKFSIEGMANMTYLASQIKDWDNRSIEITNELKDLVKNNEAYFIDSDAANNFIESLNNGKILNEKEAKGWDNTINLLKGSSQNDTFNGFLKNPDGIKFQSLIADLAKIREDRKKFVNAYLEFINDPELLNDELKETKKAADDSIKKTAFENAIKNLDDSATIQTLQDIVNSTLGATPSEEDVMQFLDTLENSDKSSGVKALGKRYRDLMKTRYQFDSTLAEMNLPEDVLNDVNKLIGLTANASNLASALLNPKSYDPSTISDDPARQTQVMEVINKLLEKVNEINKHQVSDPKPQKFDDEEIAAGPQANQFEAVEGIPQSSMPTTFMDQDTTPYENVQFADQDEELESIPGFDLEEGVLPESPIDFGQEGEQLEPPVNLSESEEAPAGQMPVEEPDPMQQIREESDLRRQLADEIERRISLPVGPEKEAESQPAEKIKVNISKDVSEYQEDDIQSSGLQVANNMVFSAIPQFDPNGFKGRKGKNKVFKSWKETLNKDSDEIIEDLSISQKDAYNIYEYLEANDAFDTVDRIDFQTGPDGTKLYVGYDPNFKLSDGRVVPLIYASVNGQLRPINMIKMPRGKWRTDSDVAVNKWLDIIQDSANKNTGTDPVVVNKKSPFYVDFAFDGEILYTPQNNITGNVKNISNNRFGYVKDGVSFRITEDRLKQEKIAVTGAVDGRHVLYVQTANGRLIATPLSSASLYQIFNTKGKDGKTPLELLKSAPKDSMDRKLYDAAKQIITAKSEGDYNQGYFKLSKIIRINFGDKGKDRRLFWDKTFYDFQKKKLVSRFEDPRLFNKFKENTIQNQAREGKPVDDDTMTDVFIEQMLFNHNTGLISNTDPNLQREDGVAFAPFTRLYINGSPDDIEQFNETVDRIKRYTFTNVGDANTVRRNFNLVIPTEAKPDKDLNDNNLGAAPVEPAFSGRVDFNGQIVNYNIASNGEVLFDVDVKGNEKNDLLNLIEATEFFKLNPAAKTKQISNRIYTKTSSGKITIRDKKMQTKSQPKTEKPSQLSKAGEYARKVKMALGVQDIGEIETTVTNNSQFTIDNVINDKTITIQMLQDSLGEDFYGVMINLQDNFTKRFPSATISLREYLEIREQNPEQNFECFGITI